MSDVRMKVKEQTSTWPALQMLIIHSDIIDYNTSQANMKRSPKVGEINFLKKNSNCRNLSAQADIQITSDIRK